MRKRTVPQSMTSNELASILQFLLDAQDKCPAGKDSPMDGSYLTSVIEELKERYRMTDSDVYDLAGLLYSKEVAAIEYYDQFRKLKINKLFVGYKAKAYIFDCLEKRRLDNRSKRWDVLKMILSAFIGSFITLLLFDTPITLFLKSLFTSLFR